MTPILWILPNVLTVLIWLWSWKSDETTGPINWKLRLQLSNPFSSAWRRGLSSDRVQELWRVRVRTLMSVLLIVAVQYGGWIHHHIFILDLRVQNLEKAADSDRGMYKRLEERVHQLESSKK